MRTTTILAVACLTLGTMPLAGCSGDGGSILGSGSSMVQKLTDTWNLSKMNGVDVTSMLPEGLKLPSFNINEDGTIAGTTGLNNFTGNLDLASLAKGEFDLGQLASTKMGGSPASMGFEQAFLEQLESVTGFKLSGDTLSLLDQGKEVLTFLRG